MQITKFELKEERNKTLKGNFLNEALGRKNAKYTKITTSLFSILLFIHLKLYSPRDTGLTVEYNWNS